MAPKSRGRLSVPTTKPLPDNLQLSSKNTHVFKTLSRLSRPALLSLATEWCSAENLKSCAPYILEGDEEEDAEAPYVAATSLSEVEGLYREELPARKGSKREVVDRILEGDWRNGVSLRQLAMAETQYVLDHPSSNRWTALCLARNGENDNEFLEDGRHLPRFHAQTFLKRLQKEIAPLSKAHYHLTRPSSFPGTVIRIALHDTPYTTSSTLLTNSSRTSSLSNNKSIFVLFPSSTPYIYVSVASAGTPALDTDAKSLQKFIVEAIPKALSQPHERYSLRFTALTARSLTALLAHRGPQRTNNAAGGWTIFADEDFNPSALDYSQKEPPKLKIPECSSEDQEEEQKENYGPSKTSGVKRAFNHIDPASDLDSRARKKLRFLTASRFGTYGLPDDGKGLHRFDVKITDSFYRRPPSRPRVARDEEFVNRVEEDMEPQEHQGLEYEDDETFKPSINLSFQGQHVFAGLRQLVESGIINGEKMAGWLTGEAGVSIAVIKGGRVQNADEGG